MFEGVGFCFGVFLVLCFVVLVFFFFFSGVVLVCFFLIQK